MSQDRHVVSDTGPLISLEKLGDGYRLLRLLYDRVLIPPSVLAEVIHGQFVDEQAYARHYGISDFLEVVEVQSSRALPESELLDPGETDAIRLALERNLPLLIEEEAAVASHSKWVFTFPELPARSSELFVLGYCR